MANKDYRLPPRRFRRRLDAVTVRYSAGLALYELHLPRQAVDLVRIIRFPWQRRSGTCTVEIRCFGEKGKRHRVPSLPYNRAKELVERVCNE